MLFDYNIGAIVLGGHVQGYGIVRILGEYNIPNVVIDTSKKNIARHSKYCISFFECQYENLIEFLRILGEEGEYKDWLLIPTDDYYVKLLSKNKSMLEQFFKITVAKWDIIKLFFNKRNTYPLAERLGIPTPKTYYPNSLDEIKDICSDLEFPCIIKPAVMLDFYRYFKKKVFICNNIHELELNYKKAIQKISPDEILIQEIIPGNCENQYSVGMFFDLNKSVNYLVGRRKRQHPIDFGNATTFAETVDVPILINYAEKILQEAGYWGICEVEFKYDERDKEYKLLEVNPRTWKWHLISYKAEIPFLLSIYNNLIYGTAKEMKDYKHSSWQDFVTDVPTILNMVIKGAFQPATSNNTIQAVFNRNDIKPFIFQLIYLPSFIYSR